MTIGGFIAKNALRNKRRAVLSILSVAVSLFLFVTLLTLLRELTQPPEDLGASLRVAVRSKVSIADPLPARQLPIIEKIPGVDAVTPFTWFGGKYRDEDVMFAQFGVRSEEIPADLRRCQTAEGAIGSMARGPHLLHRGQGHDGEIWMEESAIRSRSTGTFYPCDLELKIAGIYTGTMDDRIAFLSPEVSR